MKTESPCPISDTTFTPPYPEPFYSWGTDFRTKYPQQNGRVLPKIIRRPLAYGKSYLTLEASEFSQNTGLLGPTESMLNKLSEFQLPLTLYSDLKIFDDSQIFILLCHKAEELYKIRPAKGNPAEIKRFVRKYKEVLNKIDDFAMKKSIVLFSQEGDPRVFVDDEEIVSRNNRRFSQDSKAQKLLKKISTDGEISLNDQQNKQVLQSYYVISDMSKILLDLSLGDIGPMNHSFSRLPLRFYSTLVYLNEVLLNHSYRELPELSSNLIGRIIWSIQQNEHQTPENLSNYYLAQAMSTYSQLLCSISDLYFYRTVSPVMNQELEKGNHEISPDKRFILDYLGNPEIKRSWQAALLQSANNHYPAYSQVNPYLLASREYGDGYSSRLIESINLTHFAHWLWNILRKSKTARVEEEKKAKNLPWEKWDQRLHEISSDPNFRPLVVEMANKSLLQILLMAQEPFNKQLESYGVSTDKLYDCEIIDRLAQTITTQDLPRLLQLDKYFQGQETVRFRLFADGKEINQAVEALYQDSFPPIEIADDLINEQHGAYTGVQVSNNKIPAVYLTIDDGSHRITPIDKNQENQIKNVADLIERVFAKNNFAAVFIHFPVDVDELKIYFDQLAKPIYYSVTIMVEIQLFPLSVQKKLHRQRLDWVNFRTVGKRK